MAVALNVASPSDGFSAAGVDAISTGNFTISAGSNRALGMGIASGANDPDPPDVFKWGSTAGVGGQSLTQRGTTQQVGTYGNLSIASLVAPNTGSGNLYAHWPNPQGEVAIGGVAYNGVDQADPHNGASPNTSSGTEASTAQNLVVTTQAGWMAFMATWFLDQGGNGFTLAINNGTSRVEIEGSSLSYEGFGIADAVAAGASTTLGFTRSAAGSPGQMDWSCMGIAFKEASTALSGTIATTEGNDTAAMSGSLLYTGTVAVAEAADTVVMSGGMNATGTIAVTEGDDTAAMSGGIGAGVTGSIVANEGNDTAALAGGVNNTGVIAVSEGADTAALIGDAIGIQIPVFEFVDDEIVPDTYEDFFQPSLAQLLAGLSIDGAIVASEGNDTALMNGSLGAAISGGITANEGNDVASMLGLIRDDGIIIVLEADDAAVMAGTVNSNDRFGAIGVNEADDTSAMSGSLLFTGSIVVSEREDTVFMLGSNGSVAPVPTGIGFGSLSNGTGLSRSGGLSRSTGLS